MFWHFVVEIYVSATWRILKWLRLLFVAVRHLYQAEFYSSSVKLCWRGITWSWCSDWSYCPGVVDWLVMMVSASLHIILNSWAIDCHWWQFPPLEQSNDLMGVRHSINFSSMPLNARMACSLLFIGKRWWYKICSHVARMESWSMAEITRSAY